MRMTTSAGLAAVLAGVLLPLAAAASDVPFDHLQCRRVKDESAATRSADLASAPLGLRRGCTVKGAVREVCQPAAAAALGAPASGAATGEATGENLASERLCYRVRCEDPRPVAMQASDRFGTRPVTVGRTMRLCVAATTLR